MFRKRGGSAMEVAGPSQGTGPAGERVKKKGRPSWAEWPLKLGLNEKKERIEESIFFNSYKHIRIRHSK